MMPPVLRMCTVLASGCWALMEGRTVCHLLSSPWVSRALDGTL